ncbi:hypothetical protein VTO73DRAFT_9016 [Trametes versicolor]
MSPDRRQDRSLNGLFGNLDVATTTGPFALQFTTTSDHIVQLATVLLPTDEPTTSSISASSPGGPLLKVIISLSTVLGFAVLAAAVLLCWTRQRLRARQKRVLLPAPWPAHRAKRAAHNDVAVAANSVHARIGGDGDDSTLIRVGGDPDKEAQVDGTSANGAPRRRVSVTASSENTGRGYLKAPSLGERLCAFLAVARTRAGSLSSAGDPPPQYEPHVLPEYGAPT